MIYDEIIEPLSNSKNILLKSAGTSIAHISTSETPIENIHDGSLEF